MKKAQHTVLIGNARFSFLTDRLVRLEWSETAEFEDRPTLAVESRELDKVIPDVTRDGDRVVMRTSGLTVSYLPDATPFSAENLEIAFSGGDGAGLWRPGMAATGNLGGTTRTLDLSEGNLIERTVKNPFYVRGGEGDQRKEFLTVRVPMELDPGVISRDGWAVVDDSLNVVRTGGWMEPRPDSQRIDWYFFGYGRRYLDAIADASRLLGRQPLPPRYVFGYWWSRYWAYTDRELEALADSFDRMDIPLDVMVLDLDWHLEGWAGYTWDRRYFPDPGEFLDRMRQRGLKVSLNLHPADGVARHEEAFEAMALAMGLDPAKTERVEFDIDDPVYMKHYFSLLHHPEEERGVDFWWMDWQQGNTATVRGLDTLRWLNHLHWEDMRTHPKRRNKRPLIFSRYGGTGGGRYGIGFSGDTVASWKSLAYQPYFTATAANSLFGYWSHDIGGHMGGGATPELYLRWMQFGVYSPVLRTHTTKNGPERRFWQYPEPYSHLMMELVRHRYEIVPYLYSECRAAYDSGVSLCRPMYYHWAEFEEAYQAAEQYLFGGRMLVAPVLRAAEEHDDLAEVRVWLPPGDWVDLARGCVESGDRWITRRYLLDEIPRFVRPGTLLPGQTGARRLDAPSIRDLSVDIYGGDEGEYLLYEDDGLTQGYQEQERVEIPLSHRRSGSRREIRIGPARGAYEGFNPRKSLEIRLHGALPPSAVDVAGTPYPWSHRKRPGCWSYDGDAAVTVILTDPRDLRGEVVVRVGEQGGVDGLVDGWKGVMNRLQAVKTYCALAATYLPVHPDERLGVDLAQTGNRISRHPQSAVSEMRRVIQLLPDLKNMLAVLGHLKISPEMPDNPGRQKASAKGVALLDTLLNPS